MNILIVNELFIYRKKTAISVSKNARVLLDDLERALERLLTIFYENIFESFLETIPEKNLTEK